MAGNEAIIEACRLAYSGFADNRRERLLELISPSIVFEFPDSLPYGGTYRGIHAFNAYWANLYEHYFDSFTYDAHAVLDAGSHVIVPVRARARAKTGRETEMENCILFEVRDGVIVRARIYADTARGRDLIAPVEDGGEGELERFERGEFDPAGFSHREHVRIGRALLLRHPFAEALQRLSTGLRRTVAKAGRTDIYSETITTAFLSLVAERLLGAPEEETFDAFCERCPELLDKDALLAIYSRGRLLSPEARATFLLPDPPRSPIKGVR